MYTIQENLKLEKQAIKQNKQQFQISQPDLIIN